MFGTRAGLFVDLFLLLLVLMLPALLFAVRLVRRGRVAAHATIMRVAFFLFVAAVAAFEVEVRLGHTPDLPRAPLVIHLCLAFPALALWAYQILRGSRAVTEPALHRRRGKALLVLLSATVATGFWLYVATFVA